MRRLGKAAFFSLLLVLWFVPGCDKARQTEPPAGTPIPAPKPPKPGATPRPGELAFDASGTGDIGKAKLPCSLGPDDNEATIAEYRQHVQDAALRREPLSGLFRQASQSFVLIEALNLRPTDVVADIDAGLGVLEMNVLESGVPFAEWRAVEADQRAVDFLTFMLSQTTVAGRERIIPQFSTRDDTALPPASADIVILPEATFYLPKEAQGEQTVIQRDSLARLESMTRALREDGRWHVFAKLRPDETRDLSRLIPLVFKRLGVRLEKEEILSNGEDGAERFTHHVFIKND